MATLNDHLNAALAFFQEVAHDERELCNAVFRRTEHIETLSASLDAQKHIIDVFRIIAGNSLLSELAKECDETETDE